MKRKRNNEITSKLIVLLGFILACILEALFNIPTIRLLVLMLVINIIALIVYLLTVTGKV